MKTMKIMLALMLAVSMFLCMAACSSEETEATIVATEATTEEATEVTTEATEIPTEESTESLESNPVYTVKVVDEGGNPVEGAMVQLCDESCYPNVTNAEGVATYALVEANYKASFLKIPEGYELPEGETDFYFEEGSMEMTIVLKAVA